MAQTLIHFHFERSPSYYSDYEVDCDLLDDGFSFPDSWEHSFDLESRYFSSRSCNTRSTVSRTKAKNHCKRLPPLISAHEKSQIVKKSEELSFLIERKKANTATRVAAAPPPRVVTPAATIAVAPAPVPVYNPPAPRRTQHEIDLENALKASSTAKHESGLTFAQLQDMANRDLTPEDFEMLLMLDSLIPKKVVEEEKLGALTESKYEEKGENAECSICICPFDNGDSLKHLPCKHFFHNDCVSTWLSKHSQSCPLCNTKVTLD